VQVFVESGVLLLDALDMLRCYTSRSARVMAPPGHPHAPKAEGEGEQEPGKAAKDEHPHAHLNPAAAAALMLAEVDAEKLRCTGKAMFGEGFSDALLAPGCSA
jgi:hypothetical protein